MLCCKHDAVFHHLPISPLTGSHSYRHCLIRAALAFEQSLQTATVAAQTGVGGWASLCSSLKSQHQGCWIYPQNNLCADSSEKLKETRCENSPGKHFRARSSRKAFASLRGAPEGQEIKPLHQMSFAQPECLKPLLFAGKRPSQSSEHWQEKPAPAQVGGQIQQEQRTRPQTFCLLATQF